MTKLVLLPGMDGTGEMFEDFVAALQAQCSVVSYPPDQPLGYAELEQRVRAVLPQDAPFMLLGESFSGPLALALAAQALPNLRAVILVSSFARLPHPRLPAWLQHIISTGPFWRMPSAITARTILGKYRTPRLMEKLEHTRAAVAPQVWKARLRAVLAVDVTPLLPQVRVPVLILCARQDRLIYASAAQRLARHLPAAQVQTLDGPHWLLQARPAAAAAVIRSFAQQQGCAL